MFRNYLKVAWRNLWKNKASTAINLAGLAIAFTCCLLIAVYIQNEVGYDKFETNRNRIARVIMEYQFAGSSAATKGNFTSVRVAPVLKRNFPEVQASAVMTSSERVVHYQDKLINEKQFLYVDSSFFDIFSFPLVIGDQRSALSGSHKLVITQSAAAKYFDREDPIGKMLHIGTDSVPYEVTGVAKDCPANSQIQFDFVASFSSLGLTKDYEDSYWDANYVTYLLLKDRPSIASLQAKLPAFMKNEMKGQAATVNMYLEPFDRIHLYSPYDAFTPNTSIAYIYILAAVALLILIIAGSTYINLSTARSMERAREVGVRKVVGAARTQLFWQFISESILICLFAVLLATCIAAGLMKPFDLLTGKNLGSDALLSGPTLVFSLLVVLCISFSAGSYPALVLTRFQPMTVLKGSFKHTNSGQWLRKSLIVFQFAISVFLIIATLVVQKQLSYIQHKKLGYDREHVLVLPITDQMLPKVDLIKQELLSVANVLSVSRCVRSPAEGGGGYNMRSAIMPPDQQINVTANPVDEDFVRTMGLRLIAGSDFTPQDVKDATGNSMEKNLYHFILNESAAAQLGWTPIEAINKKMFMGPRAGYVKGVVKDFHFESLKSAIKPFVLFTEWRGRELLVKLSGQHLPTTLSSMEQKWKSLVPEKPFQYRFLDDDYNNIYNAEIRLGKLMDLFSGVAILLACIGLLGLSSYSVQQRVKEIGIRKVLGASAVGIMTRLCNDFVGLTIIALVIACPAAWLASNRWLSDFNYKTSISWVTYILAGGATVLVALAAISYHVVRAATANPVKALRTE